MAWPPGKHIETVIDQAQQVLSEVHITRHNVSQQRAVIDIDGKWKRYRIAISEIHRLDGSTRYAYYIFDSDNKLVCGFDNSRDRVAIRLRYGMDWKSHRCAEVPHQHDASRNVTLTPTPMTVETFIEWLIDNL